MTLGGKGAWLRLLAGAALAALALVYLGREVDYRAAWRGLQAAHAGWLGAALLSVWLTILAKVARWRVLLGTEGARVPLGQVGGALLVGQMLNTFLPVRVGDLVRMRWVGRVGPGQSYTLGTIVLEKVLDLLGYALFFFACFCGCRSRPG